MEISDSWRKVLPNKIRINNSIEPNLKTCKKGWETVLGRFFWKQSVQCKNFTKNVGQILISLTSPLCPLKSVCSKHPVFLLTRAKRTSNQRWLFKPRSFSAHIQKLVASVASSWRRGTQERKTLSHKTVYLSVFFGFMVLSPSAEIN